MNCAVLPLCRADVDVVWHAFIFRKERKSMDMGCYCSAVNDVLPLGFCLFPRS